MTTVNISTIGSGGGRDYSTIAAWEAATDNDLVTLDVIEIGEMYDDADFTENVDIGGATTDPGHFRILRAAKGHEYDPVTGDGARNFDSMLVNTRLLGLDSGESYAVVEGIGLVNDGSTTYSAVLAGNSDRSYVTKCAIIDKFCTADNKSIVDLSGDASTAKYIRDSIVIGDGDTSLGGERGIHGQFSSSVVMNTAVYNIGDALGDGVGINDVIQYNCVVTDSQTSDFSNSDGGDYNSSSDTTSPGSNSLDSRSSATVFNDAGADDLRPATSSPTVGAGLWVVPTKPWGPPVTPLGSGIDLENGLIARYLFNEGSGTDLLDSIGDHDMTLNETPEWRTNRMGSYLYFGGDSANEHATFSGPVASDNEKFTISFFFRKLGGENEWLWSEGVDGNNYVSLYEPVTATTLRYHIKDSDVGTLLGTWDTGCPAEDNVWHHLVITDDNGSVTTYIDGELGNTTSYTRWNWTATTSTLCGLLNSSQLETDVKDYRVWNRILSASEVSALYKSIAALLVDNMSLVDSDPLNNGLLIAMPMQDGSGSTVTDLSGNGHNGTLTGSTWKRGIPGTILSFDGDTDIITISDDTSLQVDELTVSVWVRSDDLARNFPTIVSKTILNTEGWSVAHNGTTQNPRWRVDTSEGINTWNGTAEIRDGLWHHVVLRISGNTFKGYIDNVLDVDQTFSVGNGFKANGADILIADLGSFGYEGEVADFRMWNRALNEAEISTLYYHPWKQYGGDSPKDLSGVALGSTMSIGPYKNEASASPAGAGGGFGWWGNR